MNFSIRMLIMASVCLAATSAAPQLSNNRNEKQVQEVLPHEGVIKEEVILESNLYIKPKARQNVRRVRAVLDDTLHEINAAHKRVKRQHRRRPGSQVDTTADTGNIYSNLNLGAGDDGSYAGANVNFKPFGPLGPAGYNQQQTAANGAANNNYNNGFDSGSSAAIGQAQGFLSQGANGGFGASSTSTGTQSQNFNPFGANNAAGASHSQVYHLPNGQTINFASTNTFANNGFGNNANSRGGAVSVSG